MAFSLVLLRKLLFLIRPYPDVENVCSNFEIIVLKNLINLFKITWILKTNTQFHNRKDMKKINYLKNAQNYDDLTRAWSGHRNSFGNVF